MVDFAAKAAEGKPQEVNQPRPDEGMHEVKEPEFIQWKRQGQDVTGVLVSIDPTTVKDKETEERKPVMSYMFVGMDGQRFRFLGNDDLDKKIWPRYLGFKLYIKYETDDTSRQQQGQNARKVFRVMAGNHPAPGFEHLQAA